MRTNLVLLAALALGGLARAEPPAPVPSPPKSAPSAGPVGTPLETPPSPDQAADAVLAAVHEKDDAALSVLAAKDAPDPWLVADELIHRGRFDAADSLARAAPRLDVERLPAYVASRRGKPDDGARRARLAAGNAALKAGRSADVLGSIDAIGAADSAPMDDVVGVRLAMCRGFALASLGRFEPSAAAFLAAADVAGRLGWLVQADRALYESGLSAFRGAAFAAARDAWERELSLSEQRGDRAGSARTLFSIGVAHKSLGDYAKALAIYERARTAQEALGNMAGAATTLGNIGGVYKLLGDYAKALETFERALAAHEAIGNVAGAADSLGNIGVVHKLLGDYAKALATYELALRAQDSLGDRTGSARTLGNIGSVHYQLGDYTKALAIYERALAAKEALGDKSGAAGTLSNIGGVYASQGEYARALATYERARVAQEALGDRAGAARSLGNTGGVYYLLGEYAKALATYERALAAKEALGDKADAAATLGNIGLVYDALGDPARALATYERARAAKEALGDKAGAALTLGNIGNVYSRLGDHARALAAYERSLAVKEALGEKAGAADTLGNIGNVYYGLPDYAKALATYERARAAQEALGNRAGAALTLGNIGRVHESLGDHATALATYERALAAKEALGDKAGAALTLGDIATVRLAVHDWAGAIDAARRGVALVPFLVSGLGDGQGAVARGQHASLFTVGARAAAEAHDVETVSDFVERGRAGSLLEALGARSALQSGLVPPALAADEAQARAREAYASHAYRRSLDGGDLRTTRARRRDLEVAQAAVESAVERIQREAKAAAGVIHFQPDDLAVIRRRLAPDEALVVYGLFDSGPLALVVTSADATTVTLPATTAVEAACEALLTAISDVTDTEAETRAADALRDLVVTPLGLSPETKRLLISPDGALSYVPFTLLARDREVVCVPSGTTYGRLLEDGKSRGEGVLALGDPDYESAVNGPMAGDSSRGAVRRLSRLPATADEARAIGGTVLLRRNATEKGLRDAVATKARWRSVHFACHGSIDAERPAFSSLALTADGDDDGFLTVLEVFRAKIPADLVVLSACETAKGRVVRGEGVMGLTRAFMYAGAPRVICSLWKVDDEATRALMVRFYELWNPKDGTPGMRTAEALRKAQEFVKSQEKWKHPNYWAAWVLWGLPS